MLGLDFLFCTCLGIFSEPGDVISCLLPVLRCLVSKVLDFVIDCDVFFEKFGEISL